MTIEGNDQKKRQTNWRIYDEVLTKLEQIRVKQGFTSVPAYVNYILKRLVAGETIKINKS